MHIRKGEELKAAISVLIIAASFIMMLYFMYRTITGEGVGLFRYVCVFTIGMVTIHVLSTTFSED